MGHADYYDPANHETASKFVGQKSFAAKYSAGRRWPGAGLPPNNFMDFLWPIRFNGSGPAHLRDVDEKACICNSPDLIAGLGANQVVAQGRDRARRQLCADRPDRRRQTGLFDEVREFAGTAATAAAGSNQGGARAVSGAGSAT
jgi:hypothetical protein